MLESLVLVECHSNTFPAQQQFIGISIPSKKRSNNMHARKFTMTRNCTGVYLHGNSLLIEPSFWVLLMKSTKKSRRHKSLTSIIMPWGPVELMVPLIPNELYCYFFFPVKTQHQVPSENKKPLTSCIVFRDGTRPVM